MAFIWEFNTTGDSITGRVACWPIVPGSLRLTIDDGINPKIIDDNGDGTLGNGGTGTIDYSSGYFGVDLTDPQPLTGTDILASYDPVEGGCADDCGKCATHYLRLDVVPDTITGSHDFTIVDACKRLFEKIRRDVKPIHVEILPETFTEYFVLSIGRRFDIIESDEEELDAHGIQIILNDTSW
jgi:hypothetical protein